MVTEKDIQKWKKENVDPNENKIVSYVFWVFLSLLLLGCSVFFLDKLINESNYDLVIPAIAFPIMTIFILQSLFSGKFSADLSDDEIIKIIETKRKLDGYVDKIRKI